MQCCEDVLYLFDLIDFTPWFHRADIRLHSILVIQVVGAKGLKSVFLVNDGCVSFGVGGR